MTTKGKIAERALDSLGIGGNYESDMIVRGINNLDDLMLEWEQDGVILGYNHTEETASPNDESGIPDYARQASILNLACVLGSVLRLPIDPLLTKRASKAYKNLIPITPPQVAANPYMPLGQGNRICIDQYPAYQSQGDSELLTDKTTHILVDE